MNILQILPELRVGGVETGTVDLAKQLVKLGHKSVVVSAGGELVKDLEAAGVRHYTLPVHKKSFFTVVRMIPALAKIIRAEAVEIVHARSRVPAWIAYFACRRTGALFITTCHGYYSKQPLSYVMGWAKKVIVPSNVIGRHMIEDFGVGRERIRLIPRSVDLARFSYTPFDKKKRNEFFNVGIIGRITPIKGHLDFIKAMAKVMREVPQLKVWVVGDAPSSKAAYKEHLQIMTKRLGLWNHTQFLGTQKDIPEILKHLDVLVLATTTQEAFGRVIIEAQASGVPVVATSVGGVVDIIEDGKTGLLVPASDPENMAEAVVRICKEPGLARRLTEEGYAKVNAKYRMETMVENTLEVYRQARQVPSVLIIKFSSIGDVVLASAALRAIKRQFNNGNVRVSFVVGEQAKDLLLGCPYIDELIVCDFKHREKGWRGLWRLGSMLRNKNYDIVIDFQNSRKSHVLSFLTWAPLRYGYDRKFGFLLNRRLKDTPAALDPVAHQFKLLAMLGIELKDPDLELWPAQEDKEYIERFLDSEWISPHHLIVGINVSASARWMTKVWPFAYVVKLCEELGKRDIRVVFTGTEQDAAYAQKLVAGVKNAKAINGCGKTSVNQLACLIKRCNVFITGDSAPLHVAVSVGAPTVALFGATDPRRHVPPADTLIVLRKELDCSPCYKSKCSSRKCMVSITPEEVLEAIDTLLKSARA